MFHSMQDTSQNNDLVPSQMFLEAPWVHSMDPPFLNQLYEAHPTPGGKGMSKMSFRNMCKKDVKIISKLTWSGDPFNWMTQTVIKTKHGMNKNREKKTRHLVNSIRME